MGDGRTLRATGFAGSFVAAWLLEPTVNSTCVLAVTAPWSVRVYVAARETHGRVCPLCYLLPVSYPTVFDCRAKGEPKEGILGWVACSSFFQVRCRTSKLSCHVLSLLACCPGLATADAVAALEGKPVRHPSKVRQVRHAFRCAPRGGGSHLTYSYSYSITRGPITSVATR